MPYLRQLEPGTKFRQPDLGITGVLLMVNDCRARVRIDRPQQPVEFQDRTGSARRFVARRYEVTSWTPAVRVEVLGKVSITQALERSDTMAAKKSTKKTSTKKATAKKTTAAKSSGGKTASTKKPAAKKATTNGTDKKLSALDAAAKVLGEAKEPLNTKTMIERMEAKGYWKSPGGKTPHATLYSAILREINTKGKEARFQKMDRGLFALKK